MQPAAEGQFDAAAMLRVLEVARQLAGPFDLNAVLGQVIDAGRQVLGAERGSLFLYDPTRQELYTTVATGTEGIRFPIDRGIAGECARRRQTVNVEDCYADPRFNPEVDRQTGYRTRCLIAVPLIGLDNELVGVMQLLNPGRQCFNATDERVAEALASHAAAAIQRVRLLDERMVKLKLERDLALAKEIQRKVLPGVLPKVPGYDLAAYSQPADQTGGDIYDLLHVPLTAGTEPPAGGPAPASRTPAPESAGAEPAAATPAGAAPTPAAEKQLLILIADATGHGVGPALSVTQVRSMLRIGARLGATLDELLQHINVQLNEDLGGSRFVTAFIGRLDAETHRLDYHAAGQGPLLHFRASTGACEWRIASTYPMGIFPEAILDEKPDPIALAPGDALVLLTDGFYEYQDGRGEQMGRERVAAVVRSHADRRAKELLDALLAEVRSFAGQARQLDDLTAVIVKRQD